jgi:ATP-dependent DNA helicase RecQ
VMSDATLLDLCRKRPWTTEELLRVIGIGVKKAELYGEEIFKGLEAFEAERRSVKEAHGVSSIGGNDGRDSS